MTGDVACVIVTYNSADVLPECLQPLARLAPEAQIVVVDNASQDNTIAVAEAERERRGDRVQVIQNRDNRGFAAAVNQGFRATASEFVVVLNPDVQLVDPLGPLLEVCREAGLASGLLVDATGRAQAGFTVRRFPAAMVLGLELLGCNRLWPGNRWNRRYRYLDQNLERASAASIPVEQPAGAFLVIRRDVWRQLQGFDERFWPVWFEDVDFCVRAASAGYVARLVPSVRALHSGGHSIKKIDDASREFYWYDSLLRYAAKHFTSGAYRSVCLAAGVSVVPRIVLNVLRQRNLHPVITGFRILYSSGKRLVSARQQ